MELKSKIVSLLEVILISLDMASAVNSSMWAPVGCGELSTASVAYDA